MKFRTQLIAGFVIFALLLIIISGFVIVTDQMVNKLAVQEAIANNIALEVGELGYLSNDYILYREPQQAGRWNTKFTSISKDIGSLSVDPPEQRAIVGNLAANLKNSKSVFDDIASGPVQSGSADTSSIQLSWSRMAVQNQGMIFDAGRLADIIHGQAEGVKQTRLFLVFSLMGAFVALLLISYFLFYRRMLRSLGEIQQGAAIVGSGNLTYTLKESSDDEIGDLSRSFNRMTADLRQVTASKAEIEQEVAGRKKAEEELIRKNEDIGAAYEEIASTQEELRQNIDELTQADKTLRESEEKFRILFNRMVEGSALHELMYSASGDPVDYRILDINPSFEHILGLKREDVIGKTSKEAYGVDEPPYFDIYRRVAETGQPEEFEVFFAPMKKHFAISAYSPEHGKFATIFTDITERKNAEQNIRTLLGEVQREKDRLSSLINSINDEVWFADTQKNFTLANPAALKEFALDNDSVDIEKFAASLEVYRPDGSPRPVEEAPPLRALKGEEVRNLEEIVRTPGTGEVRYRQVNSNPVRDASGNIIGAVSVVRDITARRQAEEALSEIEERFRLALRNAPVSVALQDTDLIYRWAYNQTTRRTDEIIGMTDAGLFAKEDVEWLTPLKQRILRTGEDAHAENWLTSNGRRVYLDLYFEPLRNKGGEITGIGIAAVNLTDLKLAKEELLMKNIDLNALNEELAATQEELEQNIDDLNRNEEVLRQNEERLKQALAEKEVLLSEIHHRVKNNLTAFISLLSLEGSTEETPGGLALKKDLQNRARSMALIHETLYRTHKFDDVDMGVYLSTLVEQIVNSYSSPQTIRITVEADGILLDLSRATPTGLIINEIVTNSLKYAFPQGVASCRSDPDDPCTIRITLTKTAGKYTLIVMDNGIGLSPGFDLSKTRTLGLKLVNFLAKHQIRAEIEVNTTKGTEFIFRFREKEDSA